MDQREIAIDRGYPSLFDYCRKKLRYSEAGAFLRIRAARAVNAFPRVLSDLRSGALHLDAVARLYPLLTEENSDNLLDQAAGASKREVLALVAQWGGEGSSSERDSIRYLPQRKGAPVERDSAGPPPAAERDSVGPPPVEKTLPQGETPPLERYASLHSSEETGIPQIDSGREPMLVPPPTRVRLAFTADDAFLLMVQRLRRLRRHKFPAGRLEDLLREAIEAQLDRIDPDRKAVSRAPAGSGDASKTRKLSRRIPAAVKMEVWKRDGGRCAYISDGGLHCESLDFLEYDHVIPWSMGGQSDTADNVRLLCRPHNQRLARKRFGPRKRAQGDASTPKANGKASIHDGAIK